MSEFCRLLDAGRKPDLEAFLSHHPRIAKRLRPVLEGILLIESARPYFIHK
jgi:hypothetical protein